MNPLNLSPRLQTALSLAGSAVLADIGTDHAYLPIAACLTGKAERAIACDISPGPLEHAKKNVCDYGLRERVQIRLGGGLTPLEPGEADCVVIAGMGGMRIVEILSEKMETARSAKKLILQPQHDAPRLRQFLHESFFSIYDEVLIKDGGRYYNVIAAVPLDASSSEKSESWSEAEYFYGKIIMEKGGETAKEFFKKEKEKLDKYASEGASASLYKRREFLSKFVTTL